MACGSLPYPTNNFQINKYDNCRTNYESLGMLKINYETNLLKAIN